MVDMDHNMENPEDKGETGADASKTSASGSPCFSVIVPTRHRDGLLALCLERLAPGRQELPAEEYEVIVTDDGSQSTAEAMIRERFPWVRWVPGPKRGPAVNRNNGARHARGKWLLFTDDDCEPQPGWIAGYAAAIRPGIQVYEGKTTGDGLRRSVLDETPENLTGGNLWSCNIMVSRDAFDSLGGFDETFPLAHQEDADFRERVKAAGMTFPFIEGAVVNHPPRLPSLGKRLGQMQQCRVIVWYKTGQTRPMLVHLFVSLTMLHLRKMAQAGPSRDFFRLVGSLAASSFHVALHVGEWEKKYRELYRDAKPAYKYPYG